MTSEESQRYYFPALKGLWNDIYYSYDEAIYKLDSLLSVPAYRIWAETPNQYDLPLPDKDKALLIQLAGPHGRTIYRALCIKRGIDP